MDENLHLQNKYAWYLILATSKRIRRVRTNHLGTFTTTGSFSYLYKEIYSRTLPDALQRTIQEAH